MLKILGYDSLEGLFTQIPDELKLTGKGEDFPGYSESQLRDYFSEVSRKNTPFTRFNSFLGAGAYAHYIPSALKYLAMRPEFYTAYTPYQPECSQGTLQAIFEYQTYICELTALDVANASLYDGATALVEAVLMALRIRKKQKILVSEGIHPEYRTVLETYLENSGCRIEEIPGDAQGYVDKDALKKMCADDCVACCFASPNFFGLIEDIEEINKIVRSQGALSIVVTNPLALAVLKAPGDQRVDIACGEGQMLGSPVSFGGPGFGFLAAKKEFLRQVPGRIVGKTKDGKGNDAYCLTLQTREQHIRRQNATSNICSNHSLGAIAAAIYLALMGKDGLRKAAVYSMNLARYMRTQLSQIDKVTIRCGDRFFHEFVWHIENAQDILGRLHNENILGGVHLGDISDKYENCILSCCTEIKTKTEIDHFIKTLKDIIMAYEKENISL